MNSIANSFRREVRRLAADPWDLAMVTWVPLLGVALLWWIFSAGLPRHLAGFPRTAITSISCQEHGMP